MFLQTTAGDNRGPPQQIYYLGSIVLMKKTEKWNNKYFFWKLSKKHKMKNNKQTTEKMK